MIAAREFRLIFGEQLHEHLLVEIFERRLNNRDAHRHEAQTDDHKDETSDCQTEKRRKKFMGGDESLDVADHSLTRVVLR